MRSLTVLLTGTLVGQSLAFLLTLVLSRIYTPQAFGDYTLFLASFAILGGLATLSLDKGVLFAEEDNRARFLAGVAMVAALAIGSVWVVGGSVLGFLLPSGPSFQAPHVWAVGLGVVAFGVYQALVQLRLYFKDPASVAVSKVAQGASTGGAQAALHPLLGQAGLIPGHVVGVALAVAPLLRRPGPLFRMPGLSHRDSINQLRGDVKEYVLFVTPAAFIDTVSSQLPSYVIAWLFLDATLGQYGMATRVLAAPAALVGVAIGQWYLQQTARELENDEERLALLIKTWRRLALVGLPPFALLMIWGDGIFATVFGAPWRQAGELSMILAPVLFMKFVSSPTSGIYYQLGLQRHLLWFAILVAIGRPLTMYLGGRAVGIHGGVIAMSAFEAAQILWYNAIALRRLGWPQSRET